MKWLSVVLLVIALVLSLVPAEAESGYDVRILRDTWGVPHIFGKTDADAAFGLAYAHCEDDFVTFQTSLLTSRGTMGPVSGRSGAVTDYLVRFLGVREAVDEKFETDLSPEVRAVIKAYAEGVNFYAEGHMDDLITDGLLPVTDKDIVYGFVFRAPFFYGLDGTVRELFGKERKREVSEKHASIPRGAELFAAGVEAAYDSFGDAQDMGSNAWAIGSTRTADGSTYLNINPHLAWEGPTTWYEVHIHSEEGWDMVGGLFPGMPVVTVGHNRNLGWSHTVNRPDLADVYVLEMNPDNENQYRFDGQWLDLEVSTITLRVKVTDEMTMPVRREMLTSVHGPVMRTPHGVYAIRYAGRGDIRSVEQWYRMNKATNFDEWLDAMKMRAIHSFNTLYADKDGNIFGIYNALLPIRVEGYDWRQYLPGNTSETLWSEYLPFEDLPQVKNPASAFVQNCNASPFRMTFGEGNAKEEDYSKTFGIETHMTNRALRALELHSSDDSISIDEFYAYKFDMRYSDEGYMAKALTKVLAAPEPEDALTREAVEVLAKWDLTTTPENTSAAIAVLGLKPRGRRSTDIPPVSQLHEEIGAAAKALKAYHGRIDVPWQDVNRLQRGTLDVGMGGGPDILHCVIGRPIDDGARTVGRHGDGLTLLVAWDKNGNVKSRSVHQYGTATQDSNSPHYADQAQLMINRKTKEVWLDEADIRAHLEREYRPGEE